MKLHLEFVPQPARPGPLVVTAVIAGLALCMLGNQWWMTRSATLAAQAQADQLRVLLRQEQVRLAPAEDPGALELRKAATAIRAKLHYPWNNVFASMEQVDMAGVALLSMAHDQTSRCTILQLEAIDAKALNQFLAALNAGLDAGEQWTLASYQIKPQTAGAAVRATVRSSALSAN